MSEVLAKIIRVKIKGVTKYRIVSKDGKKNLGTFTSLKAAKKRLQQIEFFKRQK